MYFDKKMIENIFYGRKYNRHLIYLLYDAKKVNLRFTDIKKGLAERLGKDVNNNDVRRHLKYLMNKDDKKLAKDSRKRVIKKEGGGYRLTTPFIKFLEKYGEIKEDEDYIIIRIRKTK